MEPDDAGSGDSHSLQEQPWGELRGRGPSPHASGCGQEAGLSAGSAVLRQLAGSRGPPGRPKDRSLGNRGCADCACAASRPASAVLSRGGARGRPLGNLEL